METIRLIARNSRLSLLQAKKVRDKIVSAFPGIKVETIARSSRGDELQDIPLQTVEGTDFFTEDIFKELEKGEADIAVHSLKDMSSEHFFGTNRFAVIDRDDTRDVAIFNASILQKIEQGQTIIIGTCSPRREEMAMGFLQQALPQLNDSFTLQTKVIRGNIDTRLRKLDNGEYDGIILATAGLNRLLSSPDDADVIQSLLRDKKKMLLPLIECVPAPCQGAIVVEAYAGNAIAIKVIEKINDPHLMKVCIEEKCKASKYGSGSLQRFGVTTIAFGDKEVVYAAGTDNENIHFRQWTPLPQPPAADKIIFSSTDWMGSFFEYEYDRLRMAVRSPVVYVANYKAVKKDQVVDQLRDKRIWAAGSKTWLQLAAKGLWIEGCADAFGLEFLEKAWSMPLCGINKNDVCIITHTNALHTWRAKGWNAVATYSLLPKRKKEVEAQLKEADIVFWTSYQQYQLYKDILKKDVQHACPFGETAQQFRREGMDMIVFPTIKAFEQWRREFIPSRSVA